VKFTFVASLVAWAVALFLFAYTVVHLQGLA